MADTIRVGIINTALFVLGQEPVADLSEAELDNSGAATKLFRNLQESRDVVPLRRHGWVCALEYATLTPAVIDGYTNWRYPTVYLVPGDSLRLWEIEGVIRDSDSFDAWGPRWQLGTVEERGDARQIIRAQNATSQLNVAYVRRCAFSAMDAHVADAVAYELAARGAYMVTVGDRGKAKDACAEAEQKVLAAISVDGTQEGDQPQADPLDSRGDPRHEPLTLDCVQPFVAPSYTLLQWCDPARPLEIVR